MISLTRHRTDAAIHAGFKDPEKTRFERELLEDQRRIRRHEIDKHGFQSGRWKPSKNQLKIETNDKCAYCEAPTSLVAYGDVEHYRPKSIYWWLAYNYDNYLVSCQLCNQKFKKAKFPVRNNRLRAPRVAKNSTDAHLDNLAGTLGPDPLNGAALQAFRQLHEAERPLLLNPYIDRPEDFYTWRADDTLQEVELVLLPTNPSSTDFVQAARDDYGLNRQELRNERFKVYVAFRTFKQILNDPGISAATRQMVQEQIERMKADNAPFAGMIRFFDPLL